MKQTFRFLMLMVLPIVLGLASCTTDSIDNPVTDLVEPQQLADYTIIDKVEEALKNGIVGNEDDDW